MTIFNKSTRIQQLFPQRISNWDSRPKRRKTVQMDNQCPSTYQDQCQSHISSKSRFYSFDMQHHRIQLSLASRPFINQSVFPIKTRSCTLHKLTSFVINYDGAWAHFQQNMSMALYSKLVPQQLKDIYKRLTSLCQQTQVSLVSGLCFNETQHAHQG